MYAEIDHLLDQLDREAELLQELVAETDEFIQRFSEQGTTRISPESPRLGSNDTGLNRKPASV